MTVSPIFSYAIILYINPWYGNDHPYLMTDYESLRPAYTTAEPKPTGRAVLTQSRCFKVCTLIKVIKTETSLWKLGPLGETSNSINYRNQREEWSQFPINKVFSGNCQEIKGEMSRVQTQRTALNLLHSGCSSKLSSFRWSKRRYSNQTLLKTSGSC